MQLQDHPLAMKMPKTVKCSLKTGQTQKKSASSTTPAKHNLKVQKAQNKATKPSAERTETRAVAKTGTKTAKKTLAPCEIAVSAGAAEESKNYH